MRLLRDFKCPHCGAETEHYIDSEATTVECQCGNLATRIIGMPHVSLEGITGAFPGAHSRWADIREQKARQQAKKQ